MARNVYFSQGTKNEQYLVEDLIIESLQIFGQDFFYIPRTLVSKDEILGEDRLSEFKNSFPIEMYFENVDSFDGQGAFIQKFGLMMEQSATLVVARRRWDQLVGRYGDTIIPGRPNEGDLLYFPLTKGLFEIKFVKHQDPFYQLGKLYVYKLQVELFQYSSERIDTGIEEVDVFETLKSMSTDPARSGAGSITGFTITNPGSGYTSATVSINSSSGYGAVAEAVINNGFITDIEVVSGGAGYGPSNTFIVNITGDGVGAAATATVATDIDKIDSYGDNNKFKQQASGVVFSENNPFGDTNPPPTPTIVYTSDSTSITTDSTTLTADIV
jgi:hypothetical protein